MQPKLQFGGWIQENFWRDTPHLMKRVSGIIRAQVYSELGMGNDRIYINL